MKLLVSILLTALLAFATGLQLPWFFIALAAFIVAVAIPQKPGKSWLGGFLGVFLIWALLAFIQTKNGGESIASQMSSLFKLGNNSFLMILVTALVGGLVGGFGALTGSFGRKLFSKEQK